MKPDKETLDSFDDRLESNPRLLRILISLSALAGVAFIVWAYWG